MHTDTRRNGRISRRAASWALALLVAAVQSLLPGVASADQAEVVSVVGRGEAKETPAVDWRLAAIGQRLRTGALVRTGDASQMALLLQDQTQLRLNQNSLLLLKDVAAGGAPTRLELRVGRTWMQARGPAGGAGGAPDARIVPSAGTAPGAALPTAAPRRSPVGVPAVVVETPNATAAIRGTDWELAVDERGAAVLTVLSGEVEFFNEFGSVLVGPSEQARAEQGKAPTKILLTDPRERVQWVTAYRAQPSRWIRERSAGLDAVAEAIVAGRTGDAVRALSGAARPDADSLLVHADLLLSLGAVTEAIALLERERARSAADGRFPALLARCYLVADRAGDAARVLAEARRTQPTEVEVWLATGDLARFEGNEREATAAYRRALALRPDSAEAWYGLGVVATDREDVRRGRRALAQALRIEPSGPGFRGELGTLETFADDFDAARASFDAALAAQPDDYVALTGLGVLHLKRGDPEAALQALLKAGVIEPRYARAALYTAVAYYQLGRRDLAVQTFRRAAELDPRDPLPHLMMSVVAYDALAWGDAVETSRAAVERMPYLRSLNQLLMNQKGFAGIGSAIAAFGMEEWAQAYAYDAYTPYWAGSHLFLADRFDGLFNRNSELYQGFLTDPTVFGASNRFSTLVPRPGDYATLVGTLARQDFKGAQAQAALNGYHNASFPFAYYASLDGVAVRPRSVDGIDGTNGVATVGLGARPSHDLGLFLFGNRARADVTYTDTGLGLPGNPATTDTRRVDGGVNVKLAPDSQSWFKLGGGRDEVTLSGPILLESDGESVPAEIGTFGTVARTEDAQWRHTIDVGPEWQTSVGVEYGRQRRPFSVIFSVGGVGVGEQEHTSIRTDRVYWSNRLRPTDALLVQADVGWTRLRTDFEREDFVVLPGGGQTVYDSFTQDRDIGEADGALGVAWRARPGLAMRLAAQRWRRPASVSTLGPVDTAGIPVDDRLVAAGGRLERARAQVEWEADRLTFWQAFADYRTVENLVNPNAATVPDFGLADLERLRNLIQINLSRTDYYEDEPEFGAGRVKAAGFAVNRILAGNASVALRYVWTEGRNTTDAFGGNSIPFVPEHFVQIGATWVALPRLQLYGVATWRSARYADEANTDRLASGWNFGVGLYWETDDKRWAFGAAAENLLSNKAAGRPDDPLVGVQVIWRQ